MNSIAIIGPGCAGLPLALQLAGRRRPGHLWPLKYFKA